MPYTRKVDFSLQEMRNLTGMSRKQFTDTLKRFCDLYGFKMKDFKTDETNPKSDYFFPVELAEPLALMIKSFGKNPRYRKNADPLGITATAYASYVHILLDDIDNSLPAFFNEAIYSLPGHLVAAEVADWAAPFVRELTHFMMNLALLGTEDIGAALATFTKKLNRMNYYLHRGNFVMSQAAAHNYELTSEELQDEAGNAQKLRRQNISLDILLAEFIRWGLTFSQDMRDLDYPELKDLLEQENALRYILGEKVYITDAEGRRLFEDIPAPDASQQRMGYYEFVMKDAIDLLQANMNRRALDTIKTKREQWKPIDKEIEDGDFVDQTANDQYRWDLVQEINDLRQQLATKERVLQRFLEVREEPPHLAFEPDEMVTERLSDYVNHCKRLDNEGKQLYEIVDHFVGQALLEFLNSDKGDAQIK